jgi:hypothetical protein
MSRSRYSEKKFLALASLLVLVFLLQGLAFLDANSQTSDEAVHLVSGYSYLAERDFRLNPEHPPLIKELAALSVYLQYGLPFEPDPGLWDVGEQWGLGLQFLYESSIPADSILFAARLPNLLLGGILVGLIGWWAYRLWGMWPGVMATALAAFEPNLIANACLVTTDLGWSLFMFLSVYLTWEQARAPSRWRILAIGLSVGLALVTKFSAITLPLTLVVVIGGWLLAGGTFSIRPGASAPPGLRARVNQASAAWLALVGVGVLVIPCAYLFSGFTFWWHGAMTAMAHQGAGHASFFMGDYSDFGWWNYFLVTIAIKTPVGTLLLFLTSLALFRFGARLGLREVSFLVLPPVLILAAGSYSQINLGLRHILPIYPFLILIGSRLATIRLERRALMPLLLGIPVAMTVMSSVRAMPHHLAYFNELIGGPGEGARYLSDANIDWGQDLKGLARYLEHEDVPMIYLSYFGNAPPEAYGIRYQYIPAYGPLARPRVEALPPELERELLAISVYNLQGVHFDDHDLYAWLREKEPITKIGYSIYVYDVTGDADSHLEIARAYLKEGPDELTILELRKALEIDPDHEEAKLLLSSLLELP